MYFYRMTVSLLFHWYAGSNAIKASVLKVRKGQRSGIDTIKAPHLTQDNNEKETTLQLDILNENQVISLFQAGDHKASINRRTRKHIKKQETNNTNDPQKKHGIGTVSKIFYWMA